MNLQAISQKSPGVLLLVPRLRSVTAVEGDMSGDSRGSFTRASLDSLLPIPLRILLTALAACESPGPPETALG